MCQTKTKFNNSKWQNGGLTSFSETCFAEYWDDLPTLTKKESATTTVIIDPYNFLHRMAISKLVMEHHTAGSAVSIWGKNHEKHWLWAYLGQLDWQRRSGRLSDPTTDTKAVEKDASISKDSWFGYMNRNFLVALYKAAANLGLVPLFSIRKSDDDGMMDVERDAAFIQCVDIWTTFLSGPHQEYIESCTSSTALKDEAYDVYYTKLWEAHNNIIATSIQHAKRMEALLPEIERKFSLGFCRVPELLQAMSWTHLGVDSLMRIGIGHLPSVFLRMDDTLKLLHETNVKEYKTTMQCIKYNEAKPEQLRRRFAFFRRLARWRIERERMPETMRMLKSDTTSTAQKMFILMRMLVKVVMPKAFLEVFFG
mmetsp:Transcript_25489/g.33804  ORF Transcript_25489/g.33804 Transcript_25489/m.33804 type:complete len:367 (-) Transcript_25489:99-1199(-)